VEEHLPMKVDPADGSIRVWDTATNEFGAYNPDGTTMTYFNSSLNSNGNSSPGRGQRYWDKQPGEDPWTGPPGGGEPGGGNGGNGGNGGGKPGGGEPGGGNGPGAGGSPEPPAPPEPPVDPVPPELPLPEIPIIP